MPTSNRKGRWNTSVAFITITKMKANHNTPEATEAIINLFDNDDYECKPFIAWEDSGRSNAHVHIVYIFRKSRNITRSTFKPIMELCQTAALKIDTMARGKTYKLWQTGETYKGCSKNAKLWAFEKISYCWIDKPDHEVYFEKQKYEDKRPTVVATIQPQNLAYYHSCREQYEAFLNKPAEEKKLAPKTIVRSAIQQDYITPEQFDDFCDGDDSPWDCNVRWHALENYDKYVKIITKLEQIRDRRRLTSYYAKTAKTYRPFQQSLSELLDSQDDRQIHAHVDSGNTGKNYFLDAEALRTDTLVVQSAETKRIAYAWNPKLHKRIIIDVPKHKMVYLNTSALEKLKNGCIFSTMHTPTMKKSEFKPAIVILGNEAPNNDWTGDRLTCSTTSPDDFVLQMQSHKDLQHDFPQIKIELVDQDSQKTGNLSNIVGFPKKEKV